MWVGRIYDAIVHPLTFSASINDACAPQVRQMPGYLRLTLSKYFDEETDAYLVVPNKIEQAQARLVSERAEQPVHFELHSLFGHAEDSSTKHIRLALFIVRSYTCPFGVTFAQAYV